LKRGLRHGPRNPFRSRQPRPTAILVEERIETFQLGARTTSTICPTAILVEERIETNEWLSVEIHPFCPTAILVEERIET
jgi:hypothetical protein